MTDTSAQAGRYAPNRPSEDTLERVNKSLQAYSDKDWNYSRITLTIKPLASIDSPYLLSLEILDLKTNEGRERQKALADEVRWGDRHSSELGMLEVVSLRLNKALLEITSDDYWQNMRPIIRIVKVEGAIPQQLAAALWYQITEVAGEEFDNR